MIGEKIVAHVMSTNAVESRLGPNHEMSYQHVRFNGLGELVGYTSPYISLDKTEVGIFLISPRVTKFHGQ